MDKNLFPYDVTEWARDSDGAFDAFMAGYRFKGRGLRQSSFAVYRGMFLRLRRWLEDADLTVVDLDEAQLELFLDSRNLSGETRHRYLLVFTALYRHLAELREIQENPARALLLQSHPPDREAPEALTPAEVEAVIASWPTVKTWKHARGKALAFVILGSGLRSSEALTLKTQELNRKANRIESIWVKRHGVHLDRTVPLQAFAEPVLQEWLSLREKSALPGALVFPADAKGGPLSPATLFRQTQTALERAGVSKRYEGPTLLRNTCGAMWLAKNPALRVQQWLGHELLRTTEQLLIAAETWQQPRLIVA